MKALVEEFHVAFDALVIRAYRHVHRPALQVDPVQKGIVRVILFALMITRHEIQPGFADEDGEIERPVQRHLLRLPRPFFAGVAPDLCGDLDASPLVPLGQPQRKPLRVGIAGVTAVDQVVVLGDDDGLVLQFGGYFHVGIQ